MKQVTAEDERGRSWIVYEGDTAWDQCQLLLKLGLKEVVLPSETFLSGNVPEKGSSIPLDAATPELVRQSPEIKQLVRRRLRLEDCVAYLRSLNVAEVAT